MSSRNLVWAGVAALLAIAWAIVLMVVPPQYPFPHRFNHDVDSPVLALEISRSAQDIRRILRPGPTPKIEAQGCYLGRPDPSKTAEVCEAQAKQFEYVSNELDLVFIPLYALALWTFARAFASRLPLITLLIAGAVVFDYVEDWQIFRALNGENSANFVPSLIKWALFGLALAGIGIILLRSKSQVYSVPTKRLVGLAYLASGLLFVVSVALGGWMGYSLIELATGVFGFLLLIQAIGFLGPHFALPGIQQTFVDDFCRARKKMGQESLLAVHAEPLEGARRQEKQNPG